ncbi:MAG TPA: hypothetical protein VFU41_13865 [Gemmatimonadales bacterium]|nr:hypothetical protein [Gemmatimonadales bacterium]
MHTTVWRPGADHHTWLRKSRPLVIDAGRELADADLEQQRLWGLERPLIKP